MGHGQNPQLVGLHFVDQIERESTQAEAANTAAERPAGKWKGCEEGLCMLHFVHELAAKPVSLTMIEESGGAEFLIGEGVVAYTRHRS